LPKADKTYGYDPKNREVILSGKKGNFKVEKPQTGFIQKNIKNINKARKIFEDQVNSSQN